MILKNEYLQVEIAALGAELMHIRDLKRGAELLWNGDPAYWKRRSPVLFPNVGKTYGNVMRVNGGEYPTSQHGFARDMEFALEDSGEDFARYLLKADASTLERYPCAFELRICYSLKGSVLRVDWLVRNGGEAPMPFTIGGHPAFCFAPGETKADCSLIFPGLDKLRYVLLDASSGTAMPENVQELPLEGGVLALSDGLFAHDALILDGGQVEEAWLCGKNGEKRIGMKSPGFPNFGVWSVAGAPFVCLEPWQGRCDNRGFCDDFARKPGAVTLNPGEEFATGYEIIVPE